MNKRVGVYLFIAILLLFSIYLIIDEPEKMVMQNFPKNVLQSKKYIQNKDVKIEYTTPYNKTTKVTESTNKKNNVNFDKNNFNTLETKQKLTQKQQELKKRYEINQQRYIAEAKFKHIKEKSDKHQKFLELRANYIKQANQNIQNIPDIQKKLAYENIQNRNKIQIMMINKNKK